MTSNSILMQGTSLVDNNESPTLLLLNKSYKGELSPAYQMKSKKLQRGFK
jgi:hypothetical protein